MQSELARVIISAFHYFFKSMKNMFAILLCFSVFTVKSQIVKFNRLYADTTPTMRNIVVTDSGYVLVGGGGTPIYILTAFIDNLGNLNLTKKIRKTSYNIYHGFENSLIKTIDNGFALTGTRKKIGLPDTEVFFVRFNNFFDTIWTKVYLSDTIFITGRACLQKANHFYLTGEKRISIINGNVNNDLLLIKTDENGNMLWYKTYGGTLQD